MKARIADIRVQYRDVELPEHCPTCDNDLTQIDGVKAFDYGMIATHGRLVSVDEPDSFIRDSGSIKAIIEDNIGPVGYWCTECEHQLANGDYWENTPVEEKG